MQPQPRPSNPYAPPQAFTGAYAGQPGYGAVPARVEGDLVTVAKTYAFPPLCVKCAAPGELRGRLQAFAWFPQWTYLLVFLGLLPAVIVQTILTKRAKLNLPLCPSCSSRWTTARVLRSLAFVLPIVVGLGLAFAGIADNSGLITLLGFLLFFPGILAVIPIDLLVFRPRTIRAVFIDDHFVTLKGVSMGVLDSMRQG
jgi:hypothetical protein